MTPIQEAITAGLIASIPGVGSMLILYGSFRSMFKNFPLHRHENGLIVYPKGFEPPEVHKLEARNAAVAGK